MLDGNLIKKLSKFAQQEKTARRWLGDDVLEKLSSKLSSSDGKKKNKTRCSDR